ncbi:1-phosphatidylinositol-4,5-bisphosphate phosphodiesterase delta-3 [Pteropus alecto]|uniref:phosphoinositide phospholipase C n=1 Tax=Pteropus alecto TaxID=9402 RepID=L5KS00_PTEAL|nr:1-phosphatidylinositol-4,5-bisphosphate phosphodiesterase delta-3 [Pteropus alecto]
MLCGRWRSCRRRRREEPPMPAQVAAAVALLPQPAPQDAGSKRPGLRALKKLGLTEDEDVRAMLRGSRLCKIRSRTWQKERLYRLQEDGLSVWFQRKIPRAPSQHIFFVQHIEAVREGHQSEGLRRFGGAFAPARCLTIAFKGRRKNLDLVAPTAEEAQQWVRGLAKLRTRLDAMSQRERLDQYPAGKGGGLGCEGRPALCLEDPRRGEI